MAPRATPDYNLAVLYPKIAAQWSPLNKRPASDFSPGSHTRVLWQCARNHGWPAKIQDRTRRGDRCPYCAGRLATPEHNLATVYPQLAKEWSPRNVKSASEVTPRSSIKAWWFCAQGHEWQTAVSTRTQGKGCSRCTGRIPTPERNLAVLYPKLAKEWSPRNAKSASGVTPMSSAKAWWLCAQKHEWRASISSRAQGSGCPYCAGMLATPRNNLAVLFPYLAQEWSPLNPRPAMEFLPGSHAIVEWRCIRGHKWPASIQNRVQDHGCPYCAGKLATPENNLAASSPHLVKEWSPRNLKAPQEFTPKSEQKVLWRCDQDHEWLASIASRVRGNGCPLCWSKQIRSAPEVALVDSLVVWLGQLTPSLNYAIPGVLWPSGHNVVPDFVVHDGPIKFVVEYDGKWFHNHLHRSRSDRAKTKILHEAGFFTIRIRESPLPVLTLDFDLVLEPSNIYQDRDQDFPYLIKTARDHIDKVCRHAYGDMNWEKFLVNPRPLTDS